MTATPSSAPRIGRNRRRSALLRLWVVALGANALGLLAAILVAKVVRNGAVTGELSTTAESGLRFAYWVVLAVVAITDALFLDEWLTQGSFRKAHLVPERRAPKGSGEDDELADVSASLRSSPVIVAFFLLISGVATYFSFNASNRGFDPWYGQIGRHLLVLRSDVGVERKLGAIEALALQSQPESVQGLDRALANEELRVAKHAAWALGVQARSPMRPVASRPLLRALRDPRPELRREASVALARLQYRVAAAALIEEVVSELDRARQEVPFDLRLLWGLGFQQDPAALPVLARALRDPDPEVARVAAWALAQHRDQRLDDLSEEAKSAGFVGPRPLASVLEQRLTTAPFEIRCAIVHALMILKDEASNLALVVAYDATPSEQRRATCPMTTIRLDPERRFDAYDVLPTETYAIVTLDAMGRMRATAPEIRARVEPWLEAMAADPEASLATRQSANSLLGGIRSQRDDFAAE